jgi:hypothetical protein
LKANVIKKLPGEKDLIRGLKAILQPPEKQNDYKHSIANLTDLSSNGKINPL